MGQQPGVQFSREDTYFEATETHKKEHPQSLPRGGEDERLDTIDLTETTRTETRTTRRLRQLTLTGKTVEARCSCGKVCKNIRGLKVHQSRTKCDRRGQQPQRTEDNSGETQETPSQVETHSTGGLSVTNSPEASTPAEAEAPQSTEQHTQQVRRERLKWP